MAEAAATWYALQVPPQAEWKVATQLKRRGHTFLVPHVLRKAKRTRHPCKLPIFARYVFVALTGAGGWHDVGKLETQPVIPVAFDDEPAKLSARDVEYLRTVKPEDLAPNADVRAALKAGDITEIARGHALEGHKARILKVVAKKAHVDVRLFGRSTLATIPLAQLQPA